jgi:hypothetical protein
MERTQRAEGENNNLTDIFILNVIFELLTAVTIKSVS